MNYIRRYDPDFDWEQFYKDLIKTTIPDGFDISDLEEKEDGDHL